MRRKLGVEDAMLAVAPLSAAAAALAAFSLLRYAAVFLALAAAAYLAASRRMGRRQDFDRDLRSAIGTLLREYRRSGSLLRALEVVSEQEYAFSAQMRAALARYKSGAGSCAFSSELAASGCRGLGEFAGVVTGWLDSGVDMSHELEGMETELDGRRGRVLRGLGAVSNAASVNRLGGAVFFPLFAGVSLNIMGFINGMNGQLTHGDISRVAAVLGSYIVISNYISSFRRRGGEPVGRRLAAFSLSCAIGISLMMGSAALSIGTL